MSLEFPQEAIITYMRGEKENLCDLIFVDDGSLKEKIGHGALCYYDND